MDTRVKPKYDAGIKLSGPQRADAYAYMLAAAPKREEIYRRHAGKGEKIGGTAYGGSHRTR